MCGVEVVGWGEDARTSLDVSHLFYIRARVNFSSQLRRAPLYIQHAVGEHNYASGQYVAFTADHF